MKKILILLLFIPLVSFGQNREALKLCISYKNSVNSFVSESEAGDALHKIISVIGASTNFILQSCNDINNALAVTYMGNRYILYDKNFMQDLNYKSNNWSSMFVLAHEIGHHINGHTRELTISKYLDSQSLFKERAEELEADEFAGFVLANLGASYEQAIQGISLIASEIDSGTHPNKTKRINAIKAGFNKAKKNPIVTQSNPNDIITYNDGSRWEGPVKKFEKTSDKVTVQAGKLGYRTIITKVPYGKGVYIYNDGRVYEGYWYDGLLKRTNNVPKKDSSSSLTKTQQFQISGNKKLKKNDYYGAIADFTKAIELEPNSGNYYRYRGFAKNNLKDYYGAVADYTKAIELDPNYPLNYSNRAFAKQSLNDYNGAIADFTKAIELDPNSGNYYRYRGLIKNYLKDYYGAVADLTKAIKLEPNSAVNYSNRAFAKQSLNDYNGAIADFTKAIELEPNSAVNYSIRAVAKKNLKDYYGAIADFTKAIELDPNGSFDYYNSRASAKESLKDYNGAVADTSKAIELEPENSTLYANRAWYKINISEAENSDYYSAINDCNKAIELDSQNDNAYNNLGNAKNKLGDLKGACNDWEIARKMGGNIFAENSLKKFCN